MCFNRWQRRRQEAGPVSGKEGLRRGGSWDPPETPTSPCREPVSLRRQEARGRHGTVGLVTVTGAAATSGLTRGNGGSGCSHASTANWSPLHALTLFFFQTNL